VINAACLEKEAKDRLLITVGMVGSQEVEVLRDTRCSGMIVKRYLVRGAVNWRAEMSELCFSRLQILSNKLT